MSNAELLALLVGNRFAGSLTTILDRVPNLRRFSAIHPADLRDCGFSADAIRKLAATFEIARRHGETEWLIGEPFKGSYDVYAHFRERLAVEPVELFIAVLLDNRHRRLKDVVVAQGALTASLVHPRLCGAPHKRGYVASRFMCG